VLPKIESDPAHDVGRKRIGAKERRLEKPKWYEMVAVWRDGGEGGGGEGRNAWASRLARHLPYRHAGRQTLNRMTSPLSSSSTASGASGGAGLGTGVREPSDRAVGMRGDTPAAAVAAEGAEARPALRAASAGGLAIGAGSAGIAGNVRGREGPARGERPTVEATPGRCGGGGVGGGGSVVGAGERAGASLK